MDFISQLHPKVVHFPIALFIVYTLLEIIGAIFKKDFFSKSAHLILFLGILGAGAAVFTGNSAFNILKEINKTAIMVPVRAIEDHSDSANLVLWYFTGLLVLRTFIVLKKKFNSGIKYLFLVLSIIGVFITYRAADLGGKLVFKYGAGTDVLKKQIKSPPAPEKLSGKQITQPVEKE